MSYGRNVIGVTPLIAAAGGGNTAAGETLNTVNNAVSFRFEAPDTRDVKGVYVNFSTATTPGTVQVRIETDASGKPSGTLYDANAVLNITPVVGWQLCQFATLPTTGLVAGNLYHIVLITTVAGTGVSLRRSYVPNGGGYPVNALDAVDGSTRTNLVENSSTVPVCTVVFEDNVEETVGFTPFATSSNFTVYGVRAAGLKVTVPTGITLSVVGITLEGALRNGTPDDLRVRVYTSAGSLVSGTTVVIPKNALLSASGKRILFRFPAAVNLATGTYRVLFDQVGNTSTSGNNWQLYSAVYRTSGLAPAYLATTTTTDITAGSPTFTDTATDIPLIGLQLSDVAVTGGGGGGSYAGVGDVRSGVDRGDGQIGTLVVPVENDVRNNLNYGAGGTEFNGDLVLPAANTVKAGTGYGADSTEFTGTVTLPAVTDVATGVTYGAGGTEFTGTLTGGGMTLSQLQAELTARGLTSGFTAGTAGGVNVLKVNGTAVDLDPNLIDDIRDNILGDTNVWVAGSVGASIGNIPTTADITNAIEALTSYQTLYGNASTAASYDSTLTLISDRVGQIYVREVSMTEQFPIASGEYRFTDAALANAPSGSGSDPLTGVIEDANGPLPAVTLKDAMQFILSFMFGLTSGGGTGTVTFRDINNSRNCITMTVDTESDRLTVVRVPA